MGPPNALRFEKRGGGVGDKANQQRGGAFCGPRSQSGESKFVMGNAEAV